MELIEIQQLDDTELLNTLIDRAHKLMISSDTHSAPFYEYLDLRREVWFRMHYGHTKVGIDTDVTPDQDQLGK